MDKTCLQQNVFDDLPCFSKHNHPAYFTNCLFYITVSSKQTFEQLYIKLYMKVQLAGRKIWLKSAVIRMTCDFQFSCWSFPIQHFKVKEGKMIDYNQVKKDKKIAGGLYPTRRVLLVWGNKNEFHCFRGVGVNN